MSGTNPFRRKDQTSQRIERHDSFRTREEEALEDHASATAPRVNTKVSEPPKAKVSKTVRIVSPQSASLSNKEDSIHSHERADYRIFSPPPPELSSPGSSDEESDPNLPPMLLSRESHTLETGDARYINPDSNSHVGYDIAAAPENPFKTSKPSVRPADAIEARSAEYKSSGQRPLYDVDDFKTLLLTGQRVPTEPANIAPLAASEERKESNDHPRTTSRTSIFDAPALDVGKEVSVVSPGRPRDLSLSEDGLKGLATTPKMKPTTPKHRHGKLVTSDAPQDVSYIDPPISNPPTSPSITDRFNSDDQGWPKPDSTSRPSDAASTDSQALNAAASEQTIELSIDQRPQKKAAPTPPPSRRHTSYAPRRSLTEPVRSPEIDEDGVEDSKTVNEPSAQSRARPAPPRPRRHGTIRQDSSSSIPSSSAQAPSASQSNPASRQIPTPPTRSPSINAASKATTESPKSHSSSVPPPPPPRRRGSSQSSSTYTKFSGDHRHLISQRSRGDSGASSISQLQMTPQEAAPEQANEEKKDVLADLSALQREVDEYRGKMGL